MMRKWLFVVGTALLVTAVGCNGGQEKPDEEPTETETSSDDGESITDKMAGEHEGDEPKANESTERAPGQPVSGEMVEYGMVEGKQLSGYLAKPDDTSGTQPGLLVIHEWWGLNDNIKKMSRRLAGEGYVVLAVDLYNGDVAEKPEQAKKLMQDAMANKEKKLQNIEAGIAYLKTAQSANTLGVLGWCFGGGWTLQTALNFPEDIDAAVMYYGQLILEKDKLEKIEAPLLGIFAEEDQAIPAASVLKFQGMLKEMNKTSKIRVFEGVDHAFANPSGKAYDPDAAEDSWEMATEWLDKYLTAPDSDAVEAETPESAE